MGDSDIDDDCYYNCYYNDSYTEVVDNIYPNITNSTTDTDVKQGEELAVQLLISVALGLIILATVIGNVFVLAAIWMERNLHSVANYLILSLAVADLLVATLVMPLAASIVVSSSWLFGSTVCDLWASTDILLCTASILHLVAIAMDRFWAVTNIDYIHQRNPTRILTMIVIIWGLSLLVSVAQLGWKDVAWQSRMDAHDCTLSRELYQIFGTLSSFYVPLAVILVLYYRIFQAARKRIRKRRPPPATSLLPRTAAETSLITTASSSNPSPEKNTEKAVLINSNGGGTSSSGDRSSSITERNQLLPPGSPNLSSSTTANIISPEATPLRKNKSSRETGESKRERKAAKTLAIITGCFIVCWLPFFTMAIILPVCKCEISPHLMSVFNWLGYFNSTLNPIIYTIFSPEFRLAFKKILFGKQLRKNRAVAV